MNPSTIILEKVLRGISKNEIQKVEYWLQLDSVSLSEGICLIFRREPSHVLESIQDIEEFMEYDQEHEYYHFAISSIQAGSLKGGETERRFWVNLDDLLNWALKRGAGNKDFVQRLVEQRVAIKAKWNATNDPPIPPSVLDEKSEEIFQKVVQTRMQMVRFVLEHKFSDNHALYRQHLHLVEEIGQLPQTEFVKYNKNHRTPPTLIQEHQIRAICKALKYLHNNLKIADLKEHEVLKKLNFEEHLPSKKTFCEWMHRENIYDRIPQKKRK